MNSEILVRYFTEIAKNLEMQEDLTEVRKNAIKKG